MKSVFRSVPILLSACCVTCLLLELVNIVVTPCISRDGCTCVQLVDAFYHGGIEAVLKKEPFFRTPPLFLPFLAAFMPFGVEAQTSAVTFNALLGGTLPILIYGIAAEILNKKKFAIMAAWFTAINPTIISLSVEPQRDIIHIFLLGCFCYFFCCSFKYGRSYDWLLCGISFSFAFLNRYEAFEILPIFFFVTLYAVLRRIFTLKAFFKGTCLFLCSACFSFFLFLHLVNMEKYIFQTYNGYFLQKFATVKSYYSRQHTGS